MKEILIIDDDKHINAMLEETLENSGFAVTKAFSGTQASKLLKSGKGFDLILLDLMLPGISGEELLKLIEDIPVIVVSAKADTADKVGLLLGGAADYITKPFDMDELLARITVQLRRYENAKDSSKLTYKDITLDNITHIAASQGGEVKLTRTEYAILKLLMLNSERAVAKLTILEKISADTPDCTEDSLKIHIHNLRKKLREISGKEYISSVWGIGFMLKEKS